MDTSNSWRSLLTSSIVMRYYLRLRAADCITKMPSHKLTSHERSNTASSVDSATRLPHSPTHPTIHPRSTPTCAGQLGERKPGANATRRDLMKYAPTNPQRNNGMGWHQPSDISILEKPAENHRVQRVEQRNEIRADEGGFHTGVRNPSCCPTFFNLGYGKMWPPSTQQTQRMAAVTICKRVH